MNFSEYEKVSRWRKSAQTWVGKAVALLTHHSAEAKTPETSWLLGSEAASLMVIALSDFELLVPLLLDEDQIEDVDRELRYFSTAMRRHRLSRKLENVEGRTPEEKKLFAQKAAELRSNA